MSNKPAGQFECVVNNGEFKGRKIHITLGEKDKPDQVALSPFTKIFLENVDITSDVLSLVLILNPNEIPKVILKLRT